MKNEGQVSDPLEPMSPPTQSGQGTAKRAAEILVNSRKDGSNEKFVIPTAAQRQALLVEFAKTGAVIYGKAFDVVKLKAEVDLNNPRDIDNIVLYEIKSTRKNVDAHFNGQFFSISTAELLVAQSLGERFQFVFVCTSSGEYCELSLEDVFKRTKKIYPTWSIQFRNDLGTSR